MKSVWSSSQIDTGTHETGLVSLAGQAVVETAGQQFTLTPYDALYAPRDSKVRITAGAAGCDLAEISAPVENRYPVQMISYTDVKRDPSLHFTTGGPTAERELNILIGKNVEAGRLLAGVTCSKPGNWTSWPPHEHSKLL